MPVRGPHENLQLCLKPGLGHADDCTVWIDRVITESSEGPKTLDLHERLTVISSSDTTRRREAYERILNALYAHPGTAVEVRTEFGDSVTAVRTGEGVTSLFHSKTKLAIRPEDRGLGIIGQLNYPQDMLGHVELFHVTVDRLRARVDRDSDLIQLAQTPLDQLFELAAKITSDERALSETHDRRSDLSNSIRERESLEESLSQQIEESVEEEQKVRTFGIAAMFIVVLGIAVAASTSLILGALLCAVSMALAAVGRYQNKNVNADTGDIMGQALDVQLGRVGELFDTHDLSRNRRAAEQSLADSHATWRSIAGNSSPSVLLSDRPRIEELSSHLRLIDNEPVEIQGDTSLLVGFASLLAELNRKFPAERVPLLVDDIFDSVPMQYHDVMRELLLRASHRRQVILESADMVVTKWAAVEAVGGDALLITDHEIDVEPIIAEAVASETTSTV